MTRRSGSRTCSPGATALLSISMLAACASSGGDASGTAAPSSSALSVSPSGTIGAIRGTTIRHLLATSIVLSATNEEGVCQTMTVPPNQAISWVPPRGWRSVTFTAPGVEPAHCTIDPSF